MSRKEEEGGEDEETTIGADQGRVAHQRDTSHGGKAWSGRKWGAPVPVSRCEQLYFMPRATLLGSYGGGDAMQAASALMLVRLDCVHERLQAAWPGFQTRIVADVRRALKDGAGSTIAKLPAPDVAPRTLADVDVCLHVQVSSHVHGRRIWNVMPQAWLFHDLVSSPGTRRGKSSWPLIGVYGSYGLEPAYEDGEADGSALSRAVGLEALSPADCHVHLVEEDMSWHIGSDMARCVSPRVDSAHAWVVVVVWDEDARTWKVEVQFLVVVSADMEDRVERLLRKCACGTNPSSFLDGWAELSSSHEHAAACLPPLRKLLRRPQGGGDTAGT